METYYSLSLSPGKIQASASDLCVVSVGECQKVFVEAAKSNNLFVPAWLFRAKTAHGLLESATW